MNQISIFILNQIQISVSLSKNYMSHKFHEDSEALNHFKEQKKAYVQFGTCAVHFNSFVIAAVEEQFSGPWRELAKLSHSQRGRPANTGGGVQPPVPPRGWKAIYSWQGVYRYTHTQSEPWALSECRVASAQIEPGQRWKERGWGGRCWRRRNFSAV